MSDSDFFTVYFVLVSGVMASVGVWEAREQ